MRFEDILKKYGPLAQNASAAFSGSSGDEVASLSITGANGKLERLWIAADLGLMEVTFEPTMTTLQLHDWTVVGAVTLIVTVEPRDTPVTSFKLDSPSIEAMGAEDPRRREVLEFAGAVLRAKGRP